MKKAHMGIYGILATGVVFLALLIITGSTTFAREAESGGGASSGPSSDSSSGSGRGGGDSGRDSARDMEESGARTVTTGNPAAAGASTSSLNPVQNTQRPVSPPVSPATVPAQVNFSGTDTGFASASDTSDLDEIIDLIERIRTLMEREGISFSDLGFDVDDSDVPDESDESGFSAEGGSASGGDSARDTEERAVLPVAMRISIEKNNDF